ncbi:hypothetical protein N824_28530 [Pedobacter sp. V48]|nr:hypothetical protein N824_28530 [Pedobacter sp. V48]
MPSGNNKLIRVSAAALKMKIGIKRNSWGEENNFFLLPL